MVKQIYIKYTLFFIFLWTISFSQKFSKEELRQLDSLNKIIFNPSSHDTLLAPAFVSLSDILYVSNIDTVMYLCKKSQNIIEKRLTHETDQKVIRSLKKTLATVLNNIGYVQNYKGQIKEALETNSKSLKLAEEFGNKQDVSICLNNIASILRGQKKYKEALEYHFKNLKTEQEIGSELGMSDVYSNIGGIYIELGKLNEALKYNSQALKIREKTSDKRRISEATHNVGVVYEGLKKFDIALDYFEKSLKIDEEISNLEGVAYTLNSIGTVYLKQGLIDKSLEYFLQSFKISNEIGRPELVKINANRLTEIYDKKGDSFHAYSMYKLFIHMRDSINNIEILRETQNQYAKYEYEKQKAIDDKEHEKHIAVEQETKKKQKILIYSITLGLVLVAGFLIFVFNRLRITNKQKLIIESQKHNLEEKHKEITDSINYAERIQRSLLASKEMLDENLKEYFIYFKPKDIVSGDFYWASSTGSVTDKKFTIATADSTGHGVPGAIMSILNVACLNEAIKEGHQLPHEILNRTRKEIISVLKRDGSADGGKDGMDCSLLAFDFKNLKLQIAAANNPVWIVRDIKNDKLEMLNEDSENQFKIYNSTFNICEIKPDKMPVGKHDKQDTPFTLHEINLQKGDIVYTLTDGFQDQFGGEKGKKYMIKNLRELILSNAHLPMHEQKQVLESTFNNWKGTNEQVDDVTIVGIKV
jgi:serine phosphatase RsbU (regulator of sigma subunit)/Tfp pilus assembly protein PilF